MRPPGVAGLAGPVRLAWGLAARAVEVVWAQANGNDRVRDQALGVAGPRLADPILFLDGETGARVATAFLVENERGEPIRAPIELSLFAGPSGDTASPLVTVSPSVLDLAPGEQALVNVAAVLGPELQADVRYLARISIPQLSQATVPIAARRRVAEAA